MADTSPPSAPATPAVLMVLNINPTTPVASFVELCTHYGPLMQILVLPDSLQPAIHSCTVYAEFFSPPDARNALHLTGTDWLGWQLIAQLVDCIPPSAFTASANQHPPTPDPAPISSVAAATLARPMHVIPIPKLPYTLSIPTPFLLDLSPISQELAASLAPQLPAAYGRLIAIAKHLNPNLVDSVSRTIYVGNLNSPGTSADDIAVLFSNCGNVLCLRTAGEEAHGTRFAFVEFEDQAAAIKALRLNGLPFRGQPIKVSHSKNPIARPAK